MNYKEEYYKIINFYKKDPPNKNEIYCEMHHIIPHSCGGSNNKDNLVLLPAADHYKVHCYLPFIYKEENKQNEYVKMLCAWKRMINSSDEKLILFNIDKNAKDYQTLREKYINEIGKLTTISQQGNNNSQYGKHWYKDPNDKTKSLCLADTDKVPEGWVPGRWFAEEKLKNMGGIKNTIWIHNGDSTKHILKDDAEKFLSNGWMLGRKDKPLKNKYKNNEPKIKPEKTIVYKRHYNFNKNNMHNINCLTLEERHEIKMKYINETLPIHYAYFKDHTWDEFLKQFPDFNFTKTYFLGLCRKYIPEYIPRFKINHTKHI